MPFGVFAIKPAHEIKSVLASAELSEYDSFTFRDRALAMVIEFRTRTQYGWFAATFRILITIT